LLFFSYDLTSSELGYRTKIFSNKKYYFDDVSETYELELTLYNYPDIIKSLKSTTFFGISEINYTYYNNPLIRLKIRDQDLERDS
jgi:hypothetical protein